MNEEFLHYLWNYRLFDNQLKTTCGDPVQLIKPGQHNRDAGPDFFNARLKIGDTLWAGNVEIHVESADWLSHHHDTDKKYDSIILHVVHKDNHPGIKRQNGQLMPTLVIVGHYDEKLYDRYRDFMENLNWIPCENLIADADRLVVNSWLERTLISRLAMKALDIEKQLKENDFNWEETFYQRLARNFGFRLNGENFERLARSLPLKCLAKHKNNLMQIEALLFGQSGLLERGFKDEYGTKLKKEYQFLRKKFNVHPIEGYTWRFLRLRPSNFPTIRIAQFAALINTSSALFSKILETESVYVLKQMFSVEASAYWNEHYVFDKKSVNRRKKLGTNAINLILINTVIPFIFVYGKSRMIDAYRDKALAFLEKVGGERNRIIRHWEKLGMPVESAFQTQALLQLKEEYCDAKRCLDCRIGDHLLRKEN
ncbi:MAG: DUF2851 family protein [Bacteroidales bacterium]|nr:DUF2851 family protein [Bacteroidales bacterium]